MPATSSSAVTGDGHTSRFGISAATSTRRPGQRPVVLVIDTGSLQIVGSINGFAYSPRSGPVEIGVGPDDRLYAMDRNGNVKVVSTLTDEVERAFTMTSPETLQISHARNEAYLLGSEPHRIEIRDLHDLETVVAVIPFLEPSPELEPLARWATRVRVAGQLLFGPGGSRGSADARPRMAFRGRADAGRAITRSQLNRPSVELG